jgi:hypothetical protein
MQNEVRTLIDDRVRQPVAAEEGGDLRTLALERHQGRRVVQQDDPVVALGGRTQALVDGRRLAARFRVDLAQERLAEVRQVRARKAADEALGADDPDLLTANLDGRPGPVEHRHAGLLHHGADLICTIAVPVVVAQDAEDGHLGQL